MGNRAQIRFAKNLYLYTQYGSPWLLQNIHKTLSNKETWNNPEKLTQVLSQEMQSEPAAEWVKKVNKVFEQFEKQGLMIIDRAPVFAVLKEPANDVEYEVDFRFKENILIKCRNIICEASYEEFLSEEFFSNEITEDSLYEFMKERVVQEKSKESNPQDVTKQK
jgi:hypothetical protein